MTDTGRIPGEGLPGGTDGDGSAALPPHPGLPGNGAPQQSGWGTEPMTEQGTPVYAYLDQPAPPGPGLDDEDDLLLMPGPQGSWSDPHPAPPSDPHLPGQPALHHPGPMAANHVMDLPISVEVPLEVPLETMPPGLGGYAGPGTYHPEAVAYAPHVPQPHAPEAVPVYENGHIGQAAHTGYEQVPAPVADAGVPYEQGLPVDGTGVPMGAQHLAPQQAGAEEAVQAPPAAEQSGEHRMPPAGPVTMDGMEGTDASGVSAEAPAEQSAPAGPPPAAPPPRRPLHMGPPIPDPPTGGVVRSLADRGPAVSLSGPQTAGPEYLDVPRDDTAGIPAQQTGEFGEQASGGWPAAQGEASQQSLIPRADSIPQQQGQAPQAPAQVFPEAPVEAALPEAEQAAPVEPAAPVESAEPVTPAEPVVPAEPVAPVAEAAAPVEVTAPVEAAPQVEQAAPVEPAAPVEHVEPVEAAPQAVQVPVEAPADVPAPAVTEIPAEAPALVEAPVQAEAPTAAEPAEQVQEAVPAQGAAEVPEEVPASAEAVAAAPVEPAVQVVAQAVAPESVPAEVALAAEPAAVPVAVVAPEAVIPARGGPAGSEGAGFVAPTDGPQFAPPAEAQPVAAEPVAESGQVAVPADAVAQDAPAEPAPVADGGAVEDVAQAEVVQAEEGAPQEAGPEAVVEAAAPEAVAEPVAEEAAAPAEEPQPEAAEGAAPAEQAAPVAEEAPAAVAQPEAAAPEPEAVAAESAPQEGAAPKGRRGRRRAVPAAEQPAEPEAPREPIALGPVESPEPAAAAAEQQPQEAPEAPEPAAAAAADPEAAEAVAPATDATAVPAPPAEEIPVPAAEPYDPAVRDAVHRVIRERRDIRNGFRPDPIPHDVLLRVLEAAHTAPSVGHSQPWDFVVIRSEKTREKMHELAMRQREAYAKSLPKARARQFRELKIEAILDTPVNIVVTADPTRGGRHTLGRHTQPQMAPYSSALAVENLWLAARAEGLGVGWVSFFDERQMVARTRPARPPGSRRVPVRRVRRRVPGGARADAGGLVAAPPAVLGRARGGVRQPRAARRAAARPAGGDAARHPPARREGARRGVGAAEADDQAGRRAGHAGDHLRAALRAVPAVPAAHPRARGGRDLRRRPRRARARGHPLAAGGHRPDGGQLPRRRRGLQRVRQPGRRRGLRHRRRRRRRTARHAGAVAAQGAARHRGLQHRPRDEPGRGAAGGRGRHRDRARSRRGRQQGAAHR